MLAGKVNKKSAPFWGGLFMKNLIKKNNLTLLFKFVEYSFSFAISIYFFDFFKIFDCFIFNLSINKGKFYHEHKKS